MRRECVYVSTAVVVLRGTRGSVGECWRHYGRWARCGCSAERRKMRGTLRLWIDVTVRKSVLVCV